MNMKETLAAAAKAKIPDGDGIIPGEEVEKPEVPKVFMQSAVYTGEYGIFGSNGAKIPRIANEYKPTCDDHIAVLEQQVARGFVFKTE